VTRTQPVATGPGTGGPTSAEKLARFAVGTTLADLPGDVVDYGKLVVLDSLICGLAAARLDRSRMVQRVAARFGGPPEATVFGLPQRVAAVNAVHANADMMNALDADDTFFNSAHFAVFGVAAALAEAERLHGSGADLLRAGVLAFEINARLNLSTSLMEYVDGEFRWSPTSSHGYGGLGAAAASAIVSGLDEGRLAHAFGLTGWMAPTAKNSDLVNRTRWSSLKYGPYGSIAQAGVLAAALAEEGYVGDADILDLEPGFFRSQGYLGTDRSELTAGLGEKWWILETSLKPYPTCRFTHASIDAVRDFVARTGTGVGEIEAVEVRMSPAAYRSNFFRNPAREIPADSVAPLNGSFNIPYAIAVSLLGVPPGPRWYDPELLGNPDVWALADRITTAPDPILDEEWRNELEKHPGGQLRRTRGSLTIRARGQEHVIESDFCEVDPWQDATRADWDFVTRKFASFCDGIVPPGQQRALIDAVREIEAVDDVATEISPLLQVG
jgi:2-methylcitrate dehydratase PrpD